MKLFILLREAIKFLFEHITFSGWYPRTKTREIKLHAIAGLNAKPAPACHGKGLPNKKEMPLG